MTKEIYQSVGIVLQSIPFKERDRILTLFTKEGGMIKLFVKGKLFIQNTLTERFTVGEYLFSQGKGELFQFCDGTLLDQNLSLRNSWEALTMGERLCGTLLRSQWLEKESPQLYILLLSFLKKIPSCTSLETLWASFLLKVLKHEGVLQLDHHCCHCHEQVTSRYAGMRFCKVHAPQASLETTADDEATICRLYEEKSFESMWKIPVTKDLVAKIETLFSQVFDDT